MHKLLNVNPKILPGIEFFPFISLQTVFPLSTEMATSGHALAVRTLTLSLCVTATSYSVLLFSPSGASSYVPLSGCQVSNLSWHLSFPPLASSPPPSRNLIPSWQAEVQKSLKATTSTAYSGLDCTCCQMPAQFSPPSITSCVTEVVT